MLAGEMYSEEGIADDGCLEAVISQSCMVSSKLLIGETIEFSGLKDPEGKPVRARITGVFQEGQENDFYWRRTPEELSGDILISEAVFRKYFTGERAGGYTITCCYEFLFEYEDLEAGQVKKLKETTEWLTGESPYRNTMSKPVYVGILDTYTRNSAASIRACFLEI